MDHLTRDEVEEVAKALTQDGIKAAVSRKKQSWIITVSEDGDVPWQRHLVLSGYSRKGHYGIFDILHATEGRKDVQEIDLTQVDRGIMLNFLIASAGNSNRIRYLLHFRRGVA